MAAVEVTISGVLYDKLSRTTRPCVLIGEASFTGLEIGGGPMPGGPGSPGIWPSPGHPAHPIAPGGPPPGIWPSPGHPAHPIAPGGPPPSVWPSPGHPDQGLPQPPEGFPEPPPEGEKPPPEEGGWGYWADDVNSWVYKPAPDEASPKEPSPEASSTTERKRGKHA
jgi:hypothetical protein